MRYITLENVNQSEFVAVPLALIESPAYRSLSSNDRLIYSILLRRTQLSKRNPDKFADDHNRLFIYYRVKDMSEYLNVGESTVTRAYNALSEYGLIIRVEDERNSSSFKKAYKIYVLYPEEDQSVVSDYDLEEVSEDEENDARSNQNESSEHVKMTTSRSSKRTSSNKEISNKEISNKEQSKNIAADAETLKRNTLFNIPQTPVKKSAMEEGNFEKVTTTEFLQYFVDRQNEIFSTKIQLSKSKQTNFYVSQFRKNFIERFQIPADQICVMIDKIIRTYKETESDERYRNCFSLDIFNLTWKIDQLMSDIQRVEQYGSDRIKRTSTASATREKEIF